MSHQLIPSGARDVRRRSLHGATPFGADAMENANSPPPAYLNALRAISDTLVANFT
jgi:hypothetical protein